MENKNKMIMLEFIICHYLSHMSFGPLENFDNFSLQQILRFQ
jgi:hypothetical protein